MRPIVVLLAALASGLALLVLASAFSPAPASTASRAWCDDPGPVAAADGAVHCEVRTVTVAPGAAVRVHAPPSGDIQVWGAERRDVEAEARIWVRGRTAPDARAVAARVVIRTDGVLRAEVPAPAPGRLVDVSFRVRVPRASDLDLTTEAGHIEIDGVHGRIRYRAVDGSVLLSGLGGDVQGYTSSGSTRIRLAGLAWSGAGLDVSVGRGDVQVDRPLGYQTTVDVETVDGVLASPSHDPYVGEQPHGHRLTMGGSRRGPVVRAVTARGDVEVRSL